MWIVGKETAWHGKISWCGSQGWENWSVFGLCQANNKSVLMEYAVKFLCGIPVDSSAYI